MILVKLSIFILIIMITTRLGFLKVNLFKTRLEELQKEIEEAETELDAVMIEWERLSAEYEVISADY